MRTFGRVLACLGLGLAGVGGVGAIAMLPPSALTGAGSYVEERRQALRSHLPDMPEVNELLIGTSDADCADGDDAASADPGAPSEAEGDEAAGCADKAPTVGVMRGGSSGKFTRSKDAAKRFLAPAPAEAPAGN